MSDELSTAEVAAMMREHAPIEAWVSGTARHAGPRPVMTICEGCRQPWPCAAERLHHTLVAAQAERDKFGALWNETALMVREARAERDALQARCASLMAVLDAAESLVAIAYSGPYAEEFLRARRALNVACEQARAALTPPAPPEAE